jgi:hypothetical protein
MIKQGSWETAGSGRDYDLHNFVDRTLGARFDNSAVVWGCQLRELLRNRTGMCYGRGVHAALHVLCYVVLRTVCACQSHPAICPDCVA